ncbi:MAG: hypothetical protein JWN48_1604 [Myxococcaceae bacterium]|nr:hypothetical protein [Myxococcaceae bacterium]
MRGRKADVKDPLYGSLLAWLREQYATLPPLLQDARCDDDEAGSEAPSRAPPRGR